jgi:hypothetical protein
MPTIQDSRILIKRSTTSGVVPTIPASNDHTDGTWLTTDIYKGELFINQADGKLWLRGDSGTVRLLRTDGDTMSGNLDMGTNDIKSVRLIKDGSNVTALSVLSRLLYDQSGTFIADFNNRATGFGVNTASYYAYLKTTNLTGNVTLEAPTTGGTIATEAYADALVTKLWKDQGAYDASGNVFPNASNTSPVVATIKAGFIWTISVAGTLGGTAVQPGDTVRALVDSPGTTSSNWALGEHDLGYTPVTNARTLTINGTTLDLSANRSWTVTDPTLTTKGDILAFSTVNARLAVGSDGQVLTADSTQATGLKWTTISTGNTFADNLFRIQDNGDATKQIAFEASGITTGTTRTLTVQDANGTIAITANKLSVFSSTSSSELAGVISDETGSGALVFATSPTLVTPVLGVASGTSLSVTGTGGNGFGEFAAQSSAPAAPASTGFRLFAGSTGNFSWMKYDGGSDNFRRTITSALTANRTFTLQDNSYTLAGTDIAQTFSAAQTFSVAPKFSSAIGIQDANGNNLIGFPSTVASAVNYLIISNAASGGNPGISQPNASGTNVSGADTVIRSQNGTGGGTASYIAFVAPTELTSGTTVQTGTTQCRIGNLAGTQSVISAIYLHGTQPTASNYNILCNGVSNSLTINAGATQVGFRVANIQYMSISSTALTLADAVNIVVNATTGTKIGTATSQKIGLWNATPIVQPTTGVAAATLVSNGGTALTSTDTFDGYTLLQVVKALRNFGLLA